MQYRTGTAITANTAYELIVEIGYIASWTGGNSSYLIELGTTNGGVFTPLASRAGSVAHLGNLSSGVVSGSAAVSCLSGSVGSGDQLTVRLAQTGSVGVSGTSDNFGFSNVRLSSEAAVPEPGTSLSLLLGLAVLGALRRRRALPLRPVAD